VTTGLDASKYRQYVSKDKPKDSVLWEQYKANKKQEKASNNTNRKEKSASMRSTASATKKGQIDSYFYNLMAKEAIRNLRSDLEKLQHNRQAKGSSH